MMTESERARRRRVMHRRIRVVLAQRRVNHPDDRDPPTDQSPEPSSAEPAPEH